MIDFEEKLRKHLAADLAHCAPRAKERLQLIEEQEAGAVRARPLEKARQRPLRCADLGLDELGDGNGKQTEPRLGSERAYDEGLASAGRAVE